MPMFKVFLNEKEVKELKQYIIRMNPDIDIDDTISKSEIVDVIEMCVEEKLDRVRGI